MIQSFNSLCSNQRRNEVKMAPGARSKFAAPPRSNLRSFGSNCVEESTCYIVGTFRRPGNAPALVKPLAATYQSFVLHACISSGRAEG